MSNEVLPCRIKKFCIHVDELNGGTVKYSITDLNGFFMEAAVVQKGRDFVEYKRRRHQRRRRIHQPSPVSQNHRMILVISKFQGEDAAGVEKEHAHRP